MPKRIILLFLCILAVCVPGRSHAANAQDVLVNSFQNCSGVPCLTIQNVAATGPWTGSQNLNDLFLSSFASCSGVPCLTVNGAGGGGGSGTVTSIGTTTPITGGTITTTGTIACPTCGVTGSPLSQFAATTSLQLSSTVTNPTGGSATGLSVFNDNPTLQGLTVTDAKNIVLSATTGTKIGTATTQKLAFYNSTPVVQPTGSVLTALSTLGLVGTPTLNFSELAGSATNAQTTATSANTASAIVTRDGSGNFSAGALTISSANKVALTAPATSATLTLADGKTLTVSNTLTLAGTDGATIILGTGGTVTYTANKLSVFAVTTSAELAGVISDKVGTAGLSFSGISGLANPSASLGLTANNGSAITGMRSDASPALDVSIAPTWTGVHTFASTKLKVAGSSSGTVTLAVPAAAGTNTLTLPAGTTDFSATGGTSQVVKQVGVGSALTVARLACADLSDSGAGCTGGAGAPSDAHYLTTQAESGLSAEVSLGALTTGLLLNTVSASVGTPSTYAGTTCTNQFARSLNASGAATCAAVDLTADVTGVLPVANGGPSWTVSTYINTSTNVDVFVPVAGGTSNSTEANIDVAPIPINMTCRNLRVQLTTAPAGGTTWDVTLRTGAVGSLSATALTCQIAGAATSCSDLTHTAALTAGNIWTYMMDATGSVASSGVYGIAMECYK